MPDLLMYFVIGDRGLKQILVKELRVNSGVEGRIDILFRCKRFEYSTFHMGKLDAK